MVAAFQAKYPATKVSTVVAGTGEIIKRMEAEAARPLGDVVWSVGPESLGAKRNLLAPYESREAAAFFPGQAPADKQWTPFTVMPYIIMYNKKLVPEGEAPKSWRDVLDPRWKGKVAYADATKSGSSNCTTQPVGVSGQSKRRHGSSTRPATVSPGVACGRMRTTSIRVIRLRSSEGL